MDSLKITFNQLFGKVIDSTQMITGANMIIYCYHLSLFY